MSNSETREHAASLIIGAFLLVSLSSTFTVYAQPSFNCSRAETVDEKAICSDPTLSEIDVVLAEAYHSYTSVFQSKKKVGRLLLEDRASCRDDKVCIAAAQWGALNTFGAKEPWIKNFAVAAVGHRAALMGRQDASYRDRIPTKLGECVKTRITDITTRFGQPINYENSDQGTAIAYKNGGYGVTYGRDWAFYDIRAGQPVIFCLMSIPRDCPDGDDRGRVYYSLNFETKDEWLLPDAQHMCGGA